MMDRIAQSVERDPIYSARIHFTETRLEPTTADALSESAAQIAAPLGQGDGLLHQLGLDRAADRARAAAGADAGDDRVAEVARRLGLQWGVHAVHTRDVNSFEEMVGKAKRMALRHISPRAATGW
jgi:pyruvate kinase